jgi:hypothetical protein
MVRRTSSHVRDSPCEASLLRSRRAAESFLGCVVRVEGPSEAQGRLRLAQRVSCAVHLRWMKCYFMLQVVLFTGI